MDHDEGRLTEEVVEDPMLIPKRISENWKPQPIDELPNAFCGKITLLMIDSDQLIDELRDGF